MAATVRASYYGASAGEPAGVTAETGITFSESDAQAPAAGTSPITIPAATGTDFSWIMLLALEVTATDSTTGTNFDFRRATAPSAGLELWADNQPTYRQPASGNNPPSQGSNGADPVPTGAGSPADYAAATTSFAVYDATGASFGTTGRKGDFLECVLAVDNLFLGGGGQAAFPDIEIQYDEA